MSFQRNFIQLLFIKFSSRIICKCCLCGSRTHTLTEWERHAGSKARKWRYSVKVESTMQPLKEWVCTSSCYIICVVFFCIKCHEEFYSLGLLQCCLVSISLVFQTSPNFQVCSYSAVMCVYCAFIFPYNAFLIFLTNNKNFFRSMNTIPELELPCSQISNKYSPFCKVNAYFI